MNSAGASKAVTRRMEHQRGKVEAQIEAALSSSPTTDQASRSLAWQRCNTSSHQHNFSPSAQVRRRPPFHVGITSVSGAAVRVLVLFFRLQKISFLSTRLFSLLKTVLPTKLLADI
ncbi:hypothetical protein VPH35_085368 [Triticum aestivum]